MSQGWEWDGPLTLSSGPLTLMSLPHLLPHWISCILLGPQLWPKE